MIKQALIPKVKLDRKFSNTQLIWFQFFTRNLKVNIKYVYLEKDIGFVFVENQEKLAHKRWIHFQEEHEAYKKYQFVFLPYKEIYELQDLFSMLFPHINIKHIEIEDENNRIVIFIPNSQLRFAIGKNGKYIQTINKFFQTNDIEQEIILRGQ